MRPLHAHTALATLVLLAFGVRALGIQNVFGEDGAVFLDLHDASYHARRALFSFVNFPSILFFDRYLNYPDGAFIPIPPLYDWLLAASARLLGESEGIFLRVAAWSSPVLGALTVLPLFAVARMMLATGPALGAAALFALLPISVNFSGIGNCDHHAWVALLATCLLGLCMATNRPQASGRRLAAFTLALVGVRAALVLSWSGSLLYIALGEGSLLLGFALSGRRDLLMAQVAGALGTALFVAPWVAASGTPLGGPFSTITLSWLHPSAFLAVAALCTLLLAFERGRASAGVLERCTRAALLGVFGIALLLSFPAIRDSLLVGGGFLAKADSWAGANPEQRALFDPHLAWKSPAQLYGYFAYLIPFTPLAALLWLRTPERRDAAAVLAVWTLALGLLALGQMRFGNDFAPIAAVAFASFLAEIPARFAPGHARRRAAVATVVAAAAILWPALAGSHLRRLPRAMAYLDPTHSPTAEIPLTPKRSFWRFAETIRSVTPETSGYLDHDGVPEYSILCAPTLGSSIQFAARRPTPSNNMGPYLNAERYDLVRSFFRSASESEALALAESVGARYVLTAANAGLRAPHIDYRLHREDGSAKGDRRHLERFRLVAEGPVGGRPLRLMYPRTVPRRLVTYKLFEIVPGAVLQARAAPGTDMVAELLVTTEVGRAFRYTARARVGSDGRALLRVPYATGAMTGVRTAPHYRVTIGARSVPVPVSEADIRAGRVVVVDSSELTTRDDTLRGVAAGDRLARRQ